MRMNLKLFRVKQKMSQAEFADAVGDSRSQYANIEGGVFDGTMKFWNALQKRFNIPDCDMWELMIKDN